MYSRVQAHSHSDDEDDYATTAPSRAVFSVCDANSPANLEGLNNKARSTSTPLPQEDTDDVFGLFSDPRTPARNDQAGKAAQPSSASMQEDNARSQASTDTQDQAASERNVNSHADDEDFDGAVPDKRELLLYAIPLFQDPDDPLNGLCFLPVSNFLEEKTYHGMTGKLKRRMDDLQDKMGTKWDELKAAEPGTFKNRVYNVGHSIANDMTPEERLTRNIPEKVSKVIIFHPRQLAPDAIMERVSRVSSGQSTWTTAKAAVASLMLPVAFGIDLILIPGPSILTWYTSFQIYKNASSALGSQRLSKYLRHGGKTSNVRVNYAGDARLDAYWEEVQHAPDGILDEDSCEQLVRDIGQHELLEPMLELRKRWIEENQLKRTRAVGEDEHAYQSLKTSEFNRS